MRAVLDAADFVALATDADGTIGYANAAAVRLLGYAPNELIGRSLLHLCESTSLVRRARHLSHELRRRIEVGWEALIARSREGRPYEYDWTVRRKDGSSFDTRLTVTMIGPVDAPTGFTFVARDLSVQRRIEQALRESEERFKGAFDHSSVGLALVAPDGRWLRVNPAFCRMLRYSAEELHARTFVDVSHPEDVGISITRDCELLGGVRDSYELEKRYIRKDGEIVWALVNVSLVHGPDKRPLHFVAQILDTTAQREARQALRESEERFRDLFENASDLIQSAETTGRYIYVNRAWREKLGYEEHEVHEMSLKDVIHPEDFERSMAMFRRLMNGEECGTIETRFRTRDHRPITVEGNVSCCFREGKPAFTRGIFRDVTERRAMEHVLDEYRGELERANRRLAEANARLEELATTDPLTGLKNRLVLHQKLAEEHVRAVRYQAPLSLVLLDVDRFKSFNDSFGHPAGDVVLHRVGKVLCTLARSTDIVARFGGEEFAVLLPNTDAEGAAALAERFRKAIEEEPWDLRTVTASFGVAAYDADMPDASALVSAADAALYRAKQRGRNRVECRHREDVIETMVVVIRPSADGRE